MTRLKLVDGQPAFSPDRRGVWIEDAGGEAGWAEAAHLPADMLEEDRALVAQALLLQSPPVAPDASTIDEQTPSGGIPHLSLTMPVPEAPEAAPAGRGCHHKQAPAAEGVTGPELAAALAAELAGKGKGGRPPKADPSPEAEAAAVQLTLAKAEVERAKADSLRQEALARIERDRERHEARLRREEDAADREAERRRDRPQSEASQSDLAQQARDARLQAQIERDRLEADVARTTRKDYKTQRRQEMTPQPPAGINTMALGCSGWVLGAGAGAFLASLLGAGAGMSAGVAIAIVLIMPWVGAFLLPQVEWAPYRARRRQEREVEESRARARRREEYLAARAATTTEEAR